MEWGIINKENFTSVKDIPIKRWDPLSTVSITTDEFGLHKKLHRFYGHYSYISPIRSKRSTGYKSKDKKIEIKVKPILPDKKEIDVFSAVLEGKSLYKNDSTLIGDGFTIIIAEDDKKRDKPFSVIPHRIEKLPNSCKAVTLVNRFPAMARIVDLEIKEKVSSQFPLNSKLAEGINLVTIAKGFYPSLDSNLIPDDVLEGIFVCMKEAILYCILEAIERDYYDIPVSPFFNIGPMAGGSQPRIHSQVYIDLNGDGHGSRLEGILKAFKEKGDKCHLCASYHGNGARVVLDSDYWTFFATGSPTRNYHLRFNPKEHIRRFSQLNIHQIHDLAISLKIIFKALDDLKIDKNRNILFNSCPYGYDANFHMFGDIIPHEIIGGAEMADDMRVARKLPVDAANEIRNAISTNT